MSGPEESLLDRMVREAVALRNAALERACEKAVQSGKYGVLVITYPGCMERIGVSELVPYGRIVELPAAGLDAWIANGCPT
jgi:hypothetical protein